MSLLTHLSASLSLKKYLSLFFFIFIFLSLSFKCLNHHLFAILFSLSLSLFYYPYSFLTSNSFFLSHVLSLSFPHRLKLSLKFYLSPLSCFFFHTYITFSFCPYQSYSLFLSPCLTLHFFSVFFSLPLSNSAFKLFQLF